MSGVPRGGVLPPYIIDQVREQVRGAEIRRAGFTDTAVVRRFRGDPNRSGRARWVVVLLETVGVAVVLLVSFLLMWAFFFQAAS